MSDIHVLEIDNPQVKVFTEALSRRVAKIQFRNVDDEESDDLEGQGLKTIIPSNIIDIYTRLEVLLGLNLSGDTGILSEASNLLDELYKRGD